MSHSFILIEFDENDRRAFDTLETAAMHMVDGEGEDDEFPAKDYSTALKFELCAGGAYESFNVLDQMEAAISDRQKSLQAEYDEEQRHASYYSQHRQTASDVL